MSNRIGNLICGVFILSACSCTKPASGPSGELVIFHAGSLSVPFRDLSEKLKSEHPGVTIRAEAAGSRDCARKISDLGRRCDVFGSADFQVINNLLVPRHADFEIQFATNEMVVAHTDKSARAGKINRENWHEILTDPDVAFGRSDPDSDPCGYRTVMLFNLAETHYRIPGLADRLAQKHGKRFIRPKETDLLALLESGEIDYLFIYRSVAQQHGLEIVRLPDEINLRSPEHTERYSQATVRVTGKKPGEFITRQGAPIVYSVTIPKSARNRDLATEYFKLLLSPAGQAIMVKNGQPALKPARCSGLQNMPAGLRTFCK